MANVNFTPARDGTSSASTSQGNTNSYVYQVFLNHRGPDVKEGLAKDIYNRLKKLGLSVFLDQEELQRGEKLDAQIEGAIRTATVHVAILSPNYAQSRWCLDELVQMLESGSTIIPVFYKVEPAEVRWTRGKYAQHLGELEPRHGPKKIEEWRNALSAVADIVGFELKDKEESQLVQEVVQQVVKKVPKPPLDVAKYPTGLDEKIKDVDWPLSLQRQNEKVTVLGIVGLGGVGKSTLAKQFFNRERSNYDRSCFLFDVRSKSLPSVQISLVKDLIQSDAQINSFAEGIERLKTVSQRSLIILDDIDHIDQMDALCAPVRDTIHVGSLILITSRNKDVLLSAGIGESSIYTLKGLNGEHSQELFCWHAFGQPSPVVGFEEVVEEFLNVCNGLPLSLKVFGALLRGKDDLKVWNAQLRKTCKVLPEDIRNTLRISYDALDKEEKQIFLDIACFFIGKDRDSAIRVWDGSYWEGLLGLRKLENRYLVEVDGKNCLRMHDHLRDLGRDIAEDLEYPRRLWHFTQNVLDNMYLESFVRGVSRANRSMLQLSGTESDSVERIFSSEQLPPLVYLHWEDCPKSSLAPSIPLNNLSVLHIEGDQLETLWQHESQAPLRLTELYVDAPLSEVPESIGKLNQLQRIVLKNGYFKSLPNEFYDMHSLKHITLQNCEQLMLLPDSVGILTGLQTLDLNGCSRLQTLPDLFGDLVNLQNINLNGCSSLQRLPYSVGNLEGFERIDLSGCSGLHMLPNWFRNLKNLRHLDLSKCSNLEMLPYSFGNLRNLQYINLSKCSNLQMLPNSLENLKQLQYMNLSWCSNFQTLPNSFGNLRNLRHIDLSWCSNLQMLPNSFGNLTNLQHINLSGCSNLPILPNSFGNLIQLKHLYLRKCYELSISNETLGQIRTLESLEISGCYGIEVLPPQITNQRFLRKMYLFCPFLKELPSAIGELSHLEILHLESSCLELLEMGELVSLEELQVRECVNLKSIQGLAQLTKLRRLDVANCSGLKELSGVEHLMSLDKLNAAGCPNLQWGSGVLEQLDKQLKGCIIK